MFGQGGAATPASGLGSSGTGGGFFGNKPATTGGFGQPAAGGAAPTGGLFGQKPATGGMFGQPAATGGFGQGAATGGFG